MNSRENPNFADAKPAVITLAFRLESDFRPFPKSSDLSPALTINGFRLLCLISRAWIFDAQRSWHRRIQAHIGSRVQCQKLGVTPAWTRLSCHDFVDNQVRLQLFVLAYNLGNFLRQAVLLRAVRHWTLTTLREKLIKIGAKVVRHSRQIVFQMAEVAVPRELFRAILEGYWAAAIGNRVVRMKAELVKNIEKYGGGVFTSGRKKALEPKMATKHPNAGEKPGRTGQKGL
jgi:hypothetical protein